MIKQGFSLAGLLLIASIGLASAQSAPKEGEPSSGTTAPLTPSKKNTKVRVKASGPVPDSNKDAQPGDMESTSTPPSGAQVIPAMPEKSEPQKASKPKPH